MFGAGEPLFRLRSSLLNNMTLLERPPRQKYLNDTNFDIEDSLGSYRGDLDALSWNGLLSVLTYLTKGIGFAWVALWYSCSLRWMPEYMLFG